MRPDSKPDFMTFDRVTKSLSAELPPEGRFISACISMPSSFESRGWEIGSVGRDLDWSRIEREAAGHFLIAPVRRFLTHDYAGRVPLDVLAGVQARFAANAIAHLRLARELISIRNALSSEGIGILAIKGPALAIQAYGTLGERQSGDLDIAIRPGDLPRIAKILVSMGYRSRRYQPGAADFGFFCCFEDQFEKPHGPLIDLHVALLPRYFPFRMHLDDIWARAVTVEFEGHSIETLSPHDHLVFSIAHASKHGWGWAPLRAMRDIAALSAIPSVDWERAEFEFEHLGCRSMLYLSTLLSKTFAGAEISDQVLQRAASDDGAVSLARQVARRLFPAPGVVPSVYCDWIVPLSLSEGLGKRARYLIDRGLRPTIEDWEAFPLPRALYWMYYLTRPMRLLLRHSPRLWQRELRPAVQ